MAKAGARTADDERRQPRKLAAGRYEAVPHRAGDAVFVHTFRGHGDRRFHRGLRDPRRRSDVRQFLGRFHKPQGLDKLRRHQARAKPATQHVHPPRADKEAVRLDPDSARRPAEFLDQVGQNLGRFVMVGIGQHAPRPRTQKRIRGVDAPDQVDGCFVRRDDAGLKIVIGGAVVAGKPEDVLGCEGHEGAQVVRPHRLPHLFQPKIVFRLAEWQRGYKRPLSGFDSDGHGDPRDDDGPGPKVAGPGRIVQSLVSRLRCGEGRAVHGAADGVAEFARRSRTRPPAQGFGGHGHAGGGQGLRSVDASPRRRGADAWTNGYCIGHRPRHRQAPVQFGGRDGWTGAVSAGQSLQIPTH